MYNNNSSSFNNNLNPFLSYNNNGNNHIHNNPNNIGYGNHFATNPFSSSSNNNNNTLLPSLYRQPMMMGSLTSMPISSRGTGRGLNANDSMDFEYLGVPPSSSSSSSFFSSSSSSPSLPTQRQSFGTNNNVNNTNININTNTNYTTFPTTTIPSLSPINPYPYFPYHYTTTTTTTTSSSIPVQEESTAPTTPQPSNRTNANPNRNTTTTTTNTTPSRNTTPSPANIFSVINVDDDDDDDEDEEDERPFRPFSSMSHIWNPPSFPSLSNNSNINPPLTQHFVTKPSPIPNIPNPLSQHQPRMSLSSFLLEAGRPRSFFDLDRPFSQNHCTCGRTNIAIPPLPIPYFTSNHTILPLPPRINRSFSNHTSFPSPSLSPLPLHSNPPPVPSQSQYPMVRVMFSSNRSDIPPSLHLNHNVGSHNLRSYFFSRPPQQANSGPFSFSHPTAQAPSVSVIHDVDFVSTKDGLPKYKWHNGLSSKECGVCLEDFTTEVEVTELPCKHIFCSECILQWLKKKNTCCLCRAVVPEALFAKGEGIDNLNPSEATRSRRERIWQILRNLRQQMRENGSETSTPSLPRIYLERSNIIQTSRHAARRF